MKRFFTISFITLALIISTAGTAPAVHADDIECTLNNGGTSCAVDGVSGICSGDENSGPYCRVTGTSDSTSFSDPAAANTPTNDKLGPPTTPKEGLNGVMAYIVQLFAWLLGVAIITLDYAVFYTVVTMGTYVNNLSAIGITWQIMRDIGNIVLIFGFLAIGISTILNTERLGYGKKMLPMLLVAAVFINFSLFLSEAVIDTGNLFATQFYTQINGGQPAGAKISSGVLSGINNEGISNKIMSSLGLLSIYGDVKNNPAKAQELLNNYWTIGFMSIILFLVAAFVMFSLAFILIARFVILLFLIIIAPIGFAGLAVPQLKGTADKWWGALFEQTITAPVLLLLLYIALRVITDTQFLTGLGATKEGWTGTVANNVSSFASVLVSFLIAMGLLMAVVIISKKMSAFGGGMATSLAGKLTFGATAFVGRRTVGRVSNFAARKIRSTRFGQSEAGRLVAGGLDRGAKASFDVRGIKAGGGLKALGGIDAGEAQKGGYRAREEELIKVRTDYAKSLKQSDAQKKEHDETLKPLKKQEADQLAASKRLIDKSKEDINAQKERVQAARNSGDKAAFEAEAKVLESMTATHKELRETEAGKLEPFREKIKNEEKRFKSAAQTKYAESLAKKRTLLRPYDVTTATGSARREAAQKILKDSNKDDVDKIKEWIESEEGRRTTPAAPTTPPPTPPATGPA